MNIIQPVKKEQFTVHRAQYSMFSYDGWPSVTRDENGVLYAVASSFRMQHICPFGKTAMYISRDGGKTWTPPIVVNDSYLDDRDAGILYMGSGRMLVSWFCHPASFYLDRYYDSIKNAAAPLESPAVLGMLESFRMIPEEYAKGGSYVKVSEDYGVTWSDPIRVPGSAPHGPNLCQDGSLIYLGKDMYITNEESNKTGKIRAYKSVDGGYSWDEIGVVAYPEGTLPQNFHEPHAVELPDGRLFGVIRAQNNAGDSIQPIRDGATTPGSKRNVGYTMFTTYSEDGGRTWSEMIPTGISGAPGHLLLHSSGALICTYSRREHPIGERAMISYDGGKTWPEEYVLTENCPYDNGYPATAELEDGSLITVYYEKIGEDRKPSILCTRWNLNENE